MRNRKLAKSIANASWGTFVQLLEQKCVTHGKTLIKVNQFFASTQICSQCGEKNGPKGYMGLGTRQWECPHCGKTHDRAVNAAVNVMNEGFRLLQEELEEDNISREEPPVMALVPPSIGGSRDDGTGAHTSSTTDH